MYFRSARYRKLLKDKNFTETVHKTIHDAFVSIVTTITTWTKPQQPTKKS